LIYRLHNFKLLSSAGLLALALTLPASASTISPGIWQEFSFTDVDTNATGCDPADPAGGFCTPSSGTPTTFLGAASWTFLAPAQGAILTVTDAFTAGDRFEIFDFEDSLGLTSMPEGETDCGDDPVPCLSTPGISHGSFFLSEGIHSLNIVTRLSTGGGSAYLEIDAVPEPGTWLMMGAGLIALALARTKRRKPLLLLSAAAGAGAVLLMNGRAVAQSPVPTRFTGPTSSQPLAMTTDDAFLAVVNPDNNSVSFFDVRSDKNRKVAEVPVQIEPNSVAITPDGRKAYVANTVSGTVSVIPLNLRNGSVSRPTVHIPVGAEPYGIALTPNGTKLYVTNARSNSVSVISTATDTVIATRPAGPEPRGIAITNDGDDDDNDETVYVTQFLAQPVPGKVTGADDSKAGHVTVFSTGTDNVIADTTINPLRDTGFKATGDALGGKPAADPADPTNFRFTTGAYPNQLNNAAIKGGFVYLPNTGASPNGPVRFDVNTQALLAVIDRNTNLDAGKTINLHQPISLQPPATRRFPTVPWAMAFRHSTNEGYVISAASNLVMKVVVDGAGQPTVQQDPNDPTRVQQIPTGKNPHGIVINAADSRAYVMNYVSRDVTVMDLSTPEHVIGTFASAAMPPRGTLEDKIQVGKELYNTSLGEFDPAPGTTTPITNRMSLGGWGSCSACHAFGRSDNVVWIFFSGPRRTIPQHADFDPTDPQRLINRALDWSAERDEEEDLERNIRLVSGGKGLIVLDDGITPDPDVVDLNPRANANRNQLKVHGVNAWDAIKAYEQFGIRAPISPASKSNPDVVAGRALFTSANCQQCHGGAQWTSGLVRFVPPLEASQTPKGQIATVLRQVGTFDAAGANEVRHDLSPAPLGADGYSPASLLSVFAFPGTFLHNGSAKTLADVLENVQHRSAGTAGVDMLANPADRAKVVQFVLSIDASTPPVPHQ
jgi:YVTN family beta-propeller protein